MRYRLRTLLILLAVGPPMIAGVWLTCQKIAVEYRARQNREIAKYLNGPGPRYVPTPTGILPVFHTNELPPNGSGATPVKPADILSPE